MKKILLFTPFYNFSDLLDEKIKSEKVRNVLKEIAKDYDLELDVYENEDDGNTLPLQEIVSKMESASYILTDLAGTNHSVTIEFTIACLLNRKLVILVPKKDEFNVSVYIGTHKKILYDRDTLASLDNADTVIIDYNSDQIATLKKFRELFSRLRDDKFAFGKPLLDLLENPPFTQILTINNLLHFESQAKDEILIFANTIQEGEKTSFIKPMAINIERGVTYRYLIPDTFDNRLGIKRLYKNLEKRLDENLELVEQRLKVMFVRKLCIDAEVTIIDPKSDETVAIELGCFENSFYALQLSRENTNSKIRRFNNIWDSVEDKESSLITYSLP